MVSSTPSNVMLPAVGRTRPRIGPTDRRLARPASPTSPSVSPAPISKLTPSTAASRERRPRPAPVAQHVVLAQVPDVDQHGRPGLGVASASCSGPGSGSRLRLGSAPAPARRTARAGPAARAPRGAGSGWPELAVRARRPDLDERRVPGAARVGGVVAAGVEPAALRQRPRARAPTRGWRPGPRAGRRVAGLGAQQRLRVGVQAGRRTTGRPRPAPRPGRRRPRRRRRPSRPPPRGRGR